MRVLFHTPGRACFGSASVLQRGWRFLCGHGSRFGQIGGRSFGRYCGENRSLCLLFPLGCFLGMRFRGFDCRGDSWTGTGCAARLDQGFALGCRALGT
ncbi:MAG TPA: hypothetical protein DCM58_01765 [Desulfovibrio sp.]|nr:hypothetical protein [Desulfovibrio sp.]